MSEPLSIVWLRRDLRLHDNAALYYALKSGRPVLVVFVFDRLILDVLEDRRDRRVEFIYKEIHKLQDQLTGMGSSLIARYGRPIDVLKSIIEEYNVAEVFTNHDYELYAKERDAVVKAMLAERGIGFQTSKDQAIFDLDEVMTGAGKPYTIFGAYSRNWVGKLNEFYLKSYPTEKYFANFYKTSPPPGPERGIPTLGEMNFEPLGENYPVPAVDEAFLWEYEKMRDYPARTGTSELGIHLRFGTISIRDLVRQARAISERFMTELAWRDFYFQILEHFPHVEKHAFRRQYEHLPFLNQPEDIERWKTGQTGYPFVDAGMRQLNQTGWMHNRARLITASFCVKHLLIDWRIGENYFGAKLRDYDLAANIGNWQWVAGTGNDPAPYFRVFSPDTQMKKFDPKLEYVRKWVPEYGTPDYVKPMIDHDFARQRAVETYKQALGKEMIS